MAEHDDLFCPGYDATRRALYTPCADARCFEGGLPADPRVLYAEMARLAYCAPAAINLVLDGVGCSGHLHFEDAHTGTQAFFTRHAASGRYVLAFRGTQADDPSDVITDAEATKVAWPPGGLVHTGFVKAFDAVWTSISRALADVPLDQLWLTGHSLGAALATLTASRLQGGHLVTFGSPRVGDETFVATLAGVSNERYVNCCDVVCQIPPPLLGYVHAGAERYLDRRGQLQTGWSADQIARDQGIGWTEYLTHKAWHWGAVAVRNLADHAPVNYCSALRNNA